MNLIRFSFYAIPKMVYILDKAAELYFVGLNDKNTKHPRLGREIWEFIVVMFKIEFRWGG